LAKIIVVLVVAGILRFGVVLMKIGGAGAGEP